MENTCGQQSSGNNNSGRKRPHAPTHDSSSSRPTIRTSPAVPINGAVLIAHAVLNSRTACTIPTGHTAPAGSTTPTHSAIQMGPTVPTGHTLLTGPASLINPTVTAGRAVPPRSTGPTYPPLLKLQAGHRSRCVIEGEYLQPLFTREHIMSLPWDPRCEEYVIAAGLYGIHKIGHIPTDHALISALVERWRPETHTFHFPIGEMTITLQDVAVLLGLRVNGKAICLRTDCHWSAVVGSLLGRHDANKITVQRFARAYCFVLVGSVLFSNHLGDSISAIYLPLFRDFERAGRYSWASGVLAYLYKELCLSTKPISKIFGGPVILLQLWSWERLPMGRPTTRQNMELPQLGGEDLTRRLPLGYGWSGYHQLTDHVTCRVMESYRRKINGLIDSEVTWLPYEDKMHLLPANCREEDRALWRTTASLIHYWIVEMHNLGRVARQFNLYQIIPPYIRDTNEGLHNLINGMGENWPHVHAKHLVKWHIRQHLCLRDQRPYDHSRLEEYMRWFSGASILYLSSPRRVPNTNSLAERVTQIAMRRTMKRLKDVADEDSRAFARQLLHHCRSPIEVILEPIGNNSIFAALDVEQSWWREVSTVLDGVPGPSYHAPTKSP